MDFNILDDLITSKENKPSTFFGDVGEYDYAAALYDSLMEYDDVDFAYAAQLTQRILRLSLAIKILDDSGDTTNLGPNLKTLLTRFNTIHDFMYDTHMFYEKMVEDEKRDADER